MPSLRRKIHRRGAEGTEFRRDDFEVCREERHREAEDSEVKN